jgi:hypothetical protein
MMNFFDETTRTFVKAIIPIAFFIVFKMGVSLIEDYFGIKAGTAVAMVIEIGVAFVAYTTLLYGSYTAAMTAERKPPIHSFAFRFFLLSFIPFAIALCSLPFLFPLGEVLSLTLFLLVFAVSTVLVLSFFGTMLPAVIDGGNRSWAAAIQRGSLTWWSVCWRLIVGPSLVMVALIGAASLLTIPSEYAIDGEIQWLTMLIFVPIVAVGMFASVMVAVILTQAYLRAESAAI